MNLFPERVLTKAYPRTFRLALLDKDVGIAADIARDMGVDAPMLELASRLYKEAHAALGEEADHVEIVRWMSGESGGDGRRKTEDGRGL
jgi:3-hydroxyisobutyrate dehydrogenase